MVELPPAFHSWRLSTLEAMAVAPAINAVPAMLVRLKKKSATAPRTAAPPKGMTMQKSCNTACRAGPAGADPLGWLAEACATDPQQYSRVFR